MGGHMANYKNNNQFYFEVKNKISGNPIVRGVYFSRFLIKEQDSFFK